MERNHASTLCVCCRFEKQKFQTGIPNGKPKVPSYDTKEKYERTELNEIYNTLQKELDGIADQVQAEYLEMQRKAARAAYVRACFDPVNGREDKEALGEYDRAEQEFVKSLYTLAEAVMKRKECTVIYDFLSESGTLTNSRISMLAFLAAIEKNKNLVMDRNSRKKDNRKKKSNLMMLCMLPGEWAA